MPLCLCGMNDKLVVRKVGGSVEAKQHLNELGFVEGTEVSVVSENCGNLIVMVKGCRIALNRSMAAKILV